MPLNKNPLVVKEFKGTLVTDIDSSIDKYTQGQIPFDYALESVNLEYMKKGGMRTRNGIENYYSFTVDGTAVQFFKIDKLGDTLQTDRWLIVASNNAVGTSVFDTGHAVPTAPIYTSGFGLISFINAFGKVYLAPLNNLGNPKAFNAVAGDAVFVYNGTLARLAGGLPPVIGAFSATPAAGGNMTVGLHLTSVLYETDTGFITNFPNTAGTAFTITAGNNTVNFANIPLGPANSGITKRHIVITKVIVNDNGDGFLAYEPFFAVVVNDNTTTTASYNRPDSGLVDSAAEQLDAIDRIPPCVNFATYGNRLAYLGFANSGTHTIGGVILSRRDLVGFSKPNIPEQLSKFEVINTTTIGGNSYIHVGPNFVGPVQVAAELGSVFYVFKDDSTFSIIDDPELDPSEWNEPKLIDSAKGAFPQGICTIGNNISNVIDGLIIVAGNHGISTFNGVFSPTSLADGIWEQYNIKDLFYTKLINDPIRKIVFIKIGNSFVNASGTGGGVNTLSDGVTPKDFILFANYLYGNDINTLRWGKYVYALQYATRDIIVRDIALRQPNTAGTTGHAEWFNLFYSPLTILHSGIRNTIGNLAINLLSESVSEADFQESSTGANEKAYPVWRYETGYTPNEQGEIYTFGPGKLRVNTSFDNTKGLGTTAVTVSKSELDSAAFSTVVILDPTVAPKKFMSYILNYVGEQMRLRIHGQNHSFIHGLYLFFTKKAEERPRG